MTKGYVRLTAHLSKDSARNVRREARKRKVSIALWLAHLVRLGDEARIADENTIRFGG